jgi:tetratricopeptide (TPR) repeat protein
MNKDKLRTLLDEWDEQVASSAGETPEQFCENRGCADLLPEFRRILSRLDEVGAILEGGAVVALTPEEMVGRIDAGRYHPVSFHAAGGLGMVFAAQDSELGRTVALKCMKDWANPDPGFRRRFLLEAEVTAHLEHPGVVPVYGMGQDAQGRLFYAMRLVGGETLSDAIRRLYAGRTENARDPKWNLEFRRLLQNFIAVCQTVAYAHSRGIIHRDIKPANIMLGTFGETLLLDWGLAKRTGSRGDEPEPDEEIIRSHRGEGPDRTMSQVALGTPRYMSPEQAAGQWDLVGPASDIYSLGASLYVLLSGRPVYEGGRETVLDKARGGQIRPPQEINASIPPALQAICLKAMAGRPQDRYATARELADDVERWLADEPVGAFDDPWRERARRWIGRHRAMVTGAAAALAVALAGLTLGLVLMTAAKNRERGLRFEADQERDKAQAAEATAQANETKARAVLGFFQKNVLAAAGPEGKGWGLGRTVTLRAAVDAAEPQIAKTLGGQPGVQAAIRQTLGDTYTFLGEPERACRQLEQALELDRAQLGANHRDTLSCARSLAWTYYQAGRYADAIALYEPTLHAMSQTLASNDPERLDALGGLGLAYRAIGKPVEAIPILEENVRLRKARLGENDPETLVQMDNLAVAYAAGGRTADAVSVQERILAILKPKLGPDHPDTLITMHNLARTYWSAQRRAEAIALLEKAVPLMKEKLGPDHPETMNATNSWGLMYVRSGKIARGLPLLEEAHKLYRAKFGPGDESTLRVANNLATAYRDADRPVDALRLFQDILSQRKLKGGTGDEATWKVMTSLAGAYMSFRQYGSARQVLSEALAAISKASGDHSVLAAGVQGDLGECLLFEGKATDAEPLLRASLLTAAAKAPDDWMTYHRRSLLGGALLRQGKRADAEPLLLAGYRGMKEHEAGIPAAQRRRLVDALERLVQLYDGWGKKEKADEWRKLALQSAALKSPR